MRTRPSAIRSSACFPCRTAGGASRRGLGPRGTRGAAKAGRASAPARLTRGVPRLGRCMHHPPPATRIGRDRVRRSARPLSCRPQVDLRPLSVTASGAGGTAQLDTRRRGEARAHAMPPTPPSAYYEFSLLDGPQKLVSLRSFRVPDSGKANIRVPMPVDRSRSASSTSPWSRWTAAPSTRATLSACEDLRRRHSKDSSSHTVRLGKEYPTAAAHLWRPAGLPHRAG